MTLPAHLPLCYQKTKRAFVRVSTHSQRRGAVVVPLRGSWLLARREFFPIGGMESDTIRILVYLTAWLSQSVVLAPVMKVRPVRLSDAKKLADDPIPQDRRFPAFVGWVLSAVALALVIWGFMYLRWFFVPIAWIVGAILAQFVEPLFDQIRLVKYGWTVPVVLTLLLWTAIR